MAAHGSPDPEYVLGTQTINDGFGNQVPPPEEPAREIFGGEKRKTENAFNDGESPVTQLRDDRGLVGKAAQIIQNLRNKKERGETVGQDVNSGDRRRSTCGERKLPAPWETRYFVSRPHVRTSKPDR